MTGMHHSDRAGRTCCRERCHCHSRISEAGNGWLWHAEKRCFSDSWRVYSIAKGDGNGMKMRLRNRLILLHCRLPLPLRRYAASWRVANPLLTAVTTRSSSYDHEQLRDRAFFFGSQLHCVSPQRRRAVGREEALGARDGAQRNVHHPIASPPCGQLTKRGRNGPRWVSTPATAKLGGDHA